MIVASTISGYLEGIYLRENFGLSDGYVAELRRAVRQFCSHCGFEPTVDELCPHLFSGWLKSLLDAGLAPATINNKRRMLMTVWKAACRWKRLPRPKTRSVKKLVEPSPIPTAWTPDQCARIFDACRRLRGSIAGVPRAAWWLSLFLAVYSCGERIRAVRLAKTLDCDIDAGTILLRWSTVKTRKNRQVWLTPDAVSAIRSIYSPTRELLWPWPYGKRHFFRQARRIIESAGVPCPKGEGKNLFQRMRRTSGSLVEAAGGDGARHLGNTRQVFEKHYRAADICGASQVHLLPVPR
jgi:integrase